MPEPLPLRALAYLSTSLDPWTDAELEKLLHVSRHYNRMRAVTGVLLCCDQTVLQYIEGPPEGVEDVMQRIRASHRHRIAHVLLDERVRERSFQDWDMGLAQPTASDLLKLSRANWQQRMNADAQPDSAGVDLLKNFWRQNLP